MYSVLLYSDTANPDGVPGDWPAEALYIPEGPNVAVEPPHRLMTNDEYNTYVNDPLRLARKQAWNDLQNGIIQPVALIKIIDVECPTNDPMFGFDSVNNKIRVPVGVPFVAHIEIRDLGDNITIPINDVFAMPILGEGWPTALRAVLAVNGVVTMNLTFQKSGIFEIREETINRELPIGGHFRFAGIKIYVVDL